MLRRLLPSEHSEHGRAKRAPAGLLGALLPICIALGFATSACGPKAPAHNGYKKNRSKPWKKAKKLKWTEGQEGALKAEIDDQVSYPKRRRARWYQVTVPDFGELTFKFSASELGEPRDEFDLAFELIDPNGKVLVRADAEEEDAGEETKERSVTEVPAGVYLVHVYTQDRNDVAEFNLRVTFKKLTRDFESDFPAKVAYLGALAAVPPVDDAPPPVIKPRRCRKPPCKRRPKPDPKPDTDVKSLKVRIVGISAKEGKTAIRAAAGKSRGVAVGWSGSVVSRSGKPIANGRFKVYKVTSTEAYGVVRASSDAVNDAKYVRLRPPK